MDNNISIMIMLLLAIEGAHMWSVLYDIDRIWSIITNEMEQMIAIRNELDHISEQANDGTESPADRFPSIDTIIINTRDSIVFY